MRPYTNNDQFQTKFPFRTYIVLHGQPSDSRCGLGLVALDLLMGVFFSSHGGRLHHVLFLNDL